MKKIYAFFGFLLFACYIPVSSLGQRSVSITGDTCLGGVLRARITGVPKLLKWYKSDTTLVMARAGWNPESVIAAGGKENGSGAEQLYSPQSIFIDDAYNLYIVDNLRIQKWAKNADSGTTVAGGNGKGTALNQFYAPTGVWVDADKNVFVSDYLTNRVVKWVPGATAGVIVAGGNGYGSGANQFAGAGQICMDKQGNLYIADRWNDRVQKWAPGASSGVTVAGGNGRGSAANQINEPYSIALDTAGNLYVADRYNNRIQKWPAGATTGITVAGSVVAGSNANQLNSPTCMYVDTAGNMFIADNGNYRVQKWAPGATFGVTVAGGSGYGRAPSKVSSSYGVTVDKTGNVYVSEIIEERVKKFLISRNIDTVFVPAVPGYYKATAVYANSGEAKSNTYRVVGIPAQPEGIKGPENVTAGQTGLVYSVRNGFPDVYYTWEVPPGMDITEGQGTQTIKVNIGAYSGRISVFASTICGTSRLSGKKNVYVSSLSLSRPAEFFADEKTGIYPNPAVSNVKVTFVAGNSEKYIVQLTDASGKLLFSHSITSQPGINKINLDVSRYAKGTYFVLVTDTKKGKQVFKLYKQ